MSALATPAAAQTVPDMSLWEAWYCQDGVTVFFGTSSENQDVIMVSFIVQAPPSLVTEVCQSHTRSSLLRFRCTQRRKDMCAAGALLLRARH